MTSQNIELPIATSLGVFIAHYSQQGLAELDFPRNGPGRRVDQVVQKNSSGKVPVEVLRWHRMTSVALKKVLTGRTAETLPPLDWTGKTDFQKSVWRAMLKIPAGKTKSYGEIAEAVGKPKAVRAVGGACGANPIPVLVPCHRVLAAHGKIGGFGSGLHWKRTLLEGEGVRI